MYWDGHSKIPKIPKILKKSKKSKKLKKVEKSWRKKKGLDHWDSGAAAEKFAGGKGRVF